MSRNKLHNAKEIIERIKTSFSIKSDRELAEYLGVNQSTISTWRSRDSLDHNLIIAKCKKVNLHWLFTGEGEMEKRTYLTGKPVDLKDIPKEGIKAWIDEYWETSDADQRAWLKIQFMECFPKYAIWLERHPEYRVYVREASQVYKVAEESSVYKVEKK
jgi:hypothetical protein